MKKWTLSILFYIKKTRLLKNGDAPIYLRITVNGYRAETTITGMLHHGCGIVPGDRQRPLTRTELS